MCQSFVPDAVVGRRDRRNARYISGGALLDPSPVRQTTELDTDHATISQTKNISSLPPCTRGRPSGPTFLCAVLLGALRHARQME